MRLAEKENKKTEKAASIKTRKNIKINWPDLVFGPVNLWSLPSAEFFYRKVR